MAANNDNIYSQVSSNLNNILRELLDLKQVLDEMNTPIKKDEPEKPLAFSKALEKIGDDFEKLYKGLEKLGNPFNELVKKIMPDGLLKMANNIKAGLGNLLKFWENIMKK